MDDQQAIRIKIEELKVTHRDLDDAIARVAESPLFDQVTLQRLKNGSSQCETSLDGWKIN